MPNNYNTPRLFLNELSIHDAEFILELVNTPGWKQFIGDRNINNTEDAMKYIQKIIDNPAYKYWVVRMIDKQVPIGIISFIKRDNLGHYDFGFSLLSEYIGRGYAYEAAAVVLKDLLKEPAYSRILAITMKENVNSIKLLEKLGFHFENQIQDANEVLEVYGISESKF